MSEKFSLEIISPVKSLVKTDVIEVTIPAFEGLMTILNNHIPLITFLRPGFINFLTSKGYEKYYVEEGTVEFYNNNLLILSSTAQKEISKEKANEILIKAKERLKNENISDKEKYILSHKVSILEGLSK